MEEAKKLVAMEESKKFAAKEEAAAAEEALRLEEEVKRRATLEGLLVPLYNYTTLNPA